MNKLNERINRFRNETIDESCIELREDKMKSNIKPKIEQQQARMRPENRTNLKDSIKVSLGLQDRLKRVVSKPEEKPEEFVPKTEAKLTNLEENDSLKSLSVEPAESLLGLAQALREVAAVLPTKTFAPPQGVSIRPIEGYSKLQQRIDGVRGYDSRKVDIKENSTEPRSLSTSGVSSASSYSPPPSSSAFTTSIDRLSSNYDEMIMISPQEIPATRIFSNKCQAPVNSPAIMDLVAADALSKLTPEQQVELQFISTVTSKYFPAVFEHFVEYWNVQGIPLNMAAVGTFLIARGFKVITSPIIFVNQ